MENDDEVYGTGNIVNYGIRIYDPRVARWLSIDPLFKGYPDWSPYNYSMDNPIYFVDPDGDEPTPAALKKAAETLGVPIASVRAVYFVETGGSAFRANGDPKILFERHYFSKLTGGQYDAKYPNISNPQWGGYGKYGDQIGRLKKAAALDKKAAYQSASYGGFQIMGANYKKAGYSSVMEFAEDMMSKDEDKHLGAFVNFIKSNPKMLKALQNKDWAEFAKYYNGPAYAKNNYDDKLEDAYDKYAGSSGDGISLTSLWDWSVTNLWDSWSMNDIFGNSQYSVNAKSLNLRASAGTKGKIIGSLSSGETLTGTGNKDGDWTEVKTSGGQTGWVSSKYIKEK